MNHYFNNNFSSQKEFQWENICGIDVRWIEECLRMSEWIGWFVLLDVTTHNLRYEKNKNKCKKETRVTQMWNWPLCYVLIFALVQLYVTIFGNLILMAWIIDLEIPNFSSSDELKIQKIWMIHNEIINQKLMYDYSNWFLDQPLFRHNFRFLSQCCCRIDANVIWVLNMYLVAIYCIFSYYS